MLLLFQLFHHVLRNHHILEETQLLLECQFKISEVDESIDLHKDESLQQQQKAGVSPTKPGNPQTKVLVQALPQQQQPLK